MTKSKQIEDPLDHRSTNYLENSEQSEFWRGRFGDEYSQRCELTRERVLRKTWDWSRILRNIEHCLPTSCCEIGSNVGINLHALNNLIDATMYAVEPNESARKILSQSGVLPSECVFDGIGSNIPLEDGAVELSISSGVLIHIAPENLLQTYRELYRVSSKYIATIEYFSDQPEAISYRGYKNKLFKRDFGQFWNNNFPDLEIVDYGFFWKGAGAGDNSNWWLHRKR